MSKAVMSRLLNNLDTHPEETIAECVGAEAIPARLFRRLLVSGQITKDIRWSSLMKDYLIGLENEADLLEGRIPPKRLSPTEERFRSNATNLRSAVTATEFTFEIFHRAIRLIDGIAYSFEVKAKRPDHPLIPPGEDVYASIMLFTSKYDRIENDGLDHNYALSTLLKQMRYQLGCETDEAFNALIAVHAQEEEDNKKLRDFEEKPSSTRNNNRKHLIRDDLTWWMFTRALRVLRLNEVTFRVFVQRQKWGNLDVSETISLDEPVEIAPPPPPALPMKFQMPSNHISLWATLPVGENKNV